MVLPLPQSESQPRRRDSKLSVRFIEEVSYVDQPVRHDSGIGEELCVVPDARGESLTQETDTEPCEIS